MESAPESDESLTPRQRYWRDHLNTCAEQRLSLRAYAEVHDLSLTSLYAASSRLKQRRGQRTSKALTVTPRFVPVNIIDRGPSTCAPATLRVHLPNGIVVEVPEHCEPVRCRALLAQMGTLS
jgi:hypothetical protein